jgi:uncharacterized membrane protein
METQSRPHGRLTNSVRKYGNDDGHRLGRSAAKRLGWLSVGLGLAEMVLPGRVAKAIGARDDERVRRTLVALGLRETMAGVGILAGRQQRRWIWARAAGDALDLALLLRAFESPRANRKRLAAATRVVAGIAALDTVTAMGLKANAGVHRPVHVVKSITVRRSPGDVYRFWRNFENLPRFMKHLESVTTNGNRSRWRVKAPAGFHVEWDAEVIEDVENERIVWCSCDDASVTNWGSVRFRRAPGSRGTEVRVELDYDPPGGRLAATIARAFGREPGQQVHSDLKRFKQFMETGDVVASDASIHPGPHPARPSASAEEHDPRTEGAAS